MALDDIPSIPDATQSAGEEEEDLHKKSDIFDTSKEKITTQKPAKNDSDDFADLDFNKKPPQQADEQAQIASEIEEQFQVLYDGDPELRKVLEKSDVSTFTVEEKYQIIEAYMQGGGAAGLQIELQDEEEEDMEDLDEATLDAMPAENKKQLEAQF